VKRRHCDDARIKNEMQGGSVASKNDDVEGRFDVSVYVGGNDNGGEEFEYRRSWMSRKKLLERVR